MSGFFYQLGQFSVRRPKLFWGAVFGIPLLAVSCSKVTDYVDAKHRAEQEKINQQASQRAVALAEKRSAENLARIQKKCVDNGAETLKAAQGHMRAGDLTQAASLIGECTQPGTFSEISAFAASVIAAEERRKQKLQAEEQRRLEKLRAETARIVAAEKRKQGVSVGMTKDDVLASSWGRPERVNTTTNSRSVREQWVYRGGYLYFENGILTTIQN